MADGVITIGELRLLPHRELRHGEEPLAIGGRALVILSELAEASGALVSKDRLMERVWPGVVVEDNALQAQVSQLRKIMGAEGKRLVAVHGRGYRLAIDASPRPPASIAVLPFENLTGGAEHAYLADGLAEELISRLAQVSGLKVPARTSSFAYRGRAIDVRTIAGELGVATVLEGSVRASGERVRIAAQLIDAGSGFHIWSENFDRTMTDLLTLQDDLAQAIATALRRELVPVTPPTEQPEAMRLVLQARAASRALTREAMEEAARLARRAIDLDPGFAKAWESLAGTRFVMVHNGYAPLAAFAEARSFAEKALALNPRTAGAVGILAALDSASGRFVEAAERMALARTLEPGDAFPREQMALSLHLLTGQIARATQLADESIALAPARAQPYLARALCGSIAGDFEAARSHLDRALALGQPVARPPVEIIRAEMAVGSGDFNDAARQMISLVVREFMVPGASATVEAVFSAMSGSMDRAEASDRAVALFAAADRTGTLWAHSGSAGLALNWQVRLGALDAAFAAADRIVARWRESGRLVNGSLNALWVPYMASFRADPRFQDFARALNLFEYWKVHGPPDGHAVENDRLICLKRLQAD